MLPISPCNFTHKSAAGGSIKWPNRQSYGSSHTTGSDTNGIGSPRGSRTPVSAVRGRRPRPLDDGAISLERVVIVQQLRWLMKKNCMLAH